jgi:hypothetical protein
MLGIGSIPCKVDLRVPDGVLARLPAHVEYWSVVPIPRSLVLAGRREVPVGLIASGVAREPERDGTGGTSSVGESNFATKSLIEAVLCRITGCNAGFDLDASIDPLREVLRLGIWPFERIL